jgi:hypothetical protein
MWFNNLVGFNEHNPEQVRSQLLLQDDFIVSKVNGKRYRAGRLETPTLKDLRDVTPAPSSFCSKLTMAEVVADVRALHADPSNEGAAFQAASQFNLLEMVSPNVVPEDGIDGYENDFTQGPACAIACGAGTIYRNYFAAVGNQIGQTTHHQIDCLSEMGKYLGNHDSQLWEMQNGYAMASASGLYQITEHLRKLDTKGHDSLMGNLKVGIQWQTEVTIAPRKALVNQVYCSALPIAYSSIDKNRWQEFARLVLNATYEATFYAALLNVVKHGNRKLYLTLVGGGAFGNDINWIFSAIERAVNLFRTTPLEIFIVSHGRSNPQLKAFIDKMMSTEE